MINNLTDFASRGIERMGKDLPLMHIDKLPLAVAIVIDKVQLLQGQATARIETTKGISQEQLIAMLESMKKAEAKEIETEAVIAELPESPSGTPALDARFADPSTLIHQRNLREYEQREASVRHWTGEP
jgi:hypothetical protein